MEPRGTWRPLTGSEGMEEGETTEEYSDPSNQMAPLGTRRLLTRDEAMKVDKEYEADEEYEEDKEAEEASSKRVRAKSPDCLEDFTKVSFSLQDIEDIFSICQTPRALIVNGQFRNLDKASQERLLEPDQCSFFLFSGKWDRDLILLASKIDQKAIQCYHFGDAGGAKFIGDAANVREYLDSSRVFTAYPTEWAERGLSRQRPAYRDNTVHLLVTGLHILANIEIPIHIEDLHWKAVLWMLLELRRNEDFDIFQKSMGIFLIHEKEASTISELKVSMEKLRSDKSIISGILDFLTDVYTELDKGKEVLSQHHETLDKELEKYAKLSISRPLLDVFPESSAINEQGSCTAFWLASDQYTVAIKARREGLQKQYDEVHLRCRLILTLESILDALRQLESKLFSRGRLLAWRSSPEGAEWSAFLDSSPYATSIDDKMEA